jgi:oxygen-dependent protoporphyrinogen oxidase
MAEKNSGNEVLILGGGISGLGVGWELHKAGIPFKLIEMQSETGGMISSSTVDRTVLDFGPNSLRDRDGHIRRLAKELSLTDDVIQISDAFKTRFIVRNQKLHTLTPSIKTLFTTKVISGKAKWRVLAEPFISKGNDEDESVGDFLERRIGKEAVDYLVDPVFSGIYAGDIYQISKKEILPQLQENEQKLGSLVMGALRSKTQKTNIEPMVLSFRKGVQQLTDAITQKISENITHEEVIAIKKRKEGFEVKTSKQSYQSEKVISCLPAHALESVLHGFKSSLQRALRDIDYAPMLSTQIVFNVQDIELPNSGFGFLIPRKENIRLLGAIWKSSIFPELSGSDQFHFTLMTGGAHDKEVLSEDIAEIEKQILNEFSNLTGITAKPNLVRSHLWRKAIPQFHVGYESVRQEIHIAEKQNSGFYIGGNYRWGVSVPDCVKGANKIVRALEV